MADTGSQKQPKTFGEAIYGDKVSKVVDGNLIEGSIKLKRIYKSGFGIETVFSKIRLTNGKPYGMTTSTDEPLIEEIGKHRRRVLEHRAKKRR